MRRLLILLALIPASIACWGFVDMKLWTWFAVPLGAPRIGMLHAWGLGLTAWALFANKNMNTEEEKDAHTIGRGVVLPWLILGFGAAVHSLSGLP